MEDLTPNCLLRQIGASRCQVTTTKACPRCGWDTEVLKERNAQIKTNGLTLCSDGLYRCIIRKGGKTDGNT
jgi:hypothetical protein